MSKTPEKIHFYHIPRTGGFSVYKFFKILNANRTKEGKPVIWLSNNGHTPWAPKDCPTFTFLRDPVIHVCSTYSYIRSHKAHRGSKFAQERTLSQWIREVPSIGSFVRFFDRPNGSLEEAIKRAEKTSIIGFTDRYNEDMNALMDFLNAGVKYNNKKHNFSGKRAVPTKSDIEFIKKARADDYELIDSIVRSRNLKPLKFV